MNQNQTAVYHRLHMGCGESLRSKLLLDVPPPLQVEMIDRPQPKLNAVKTSRGQARE